MATAIARTSTNKKTVVPQRAKNELGHKTLPRDCSKRGTIVSTQLISIWSKQKVVSSSLYYEMVSSFNLLLPNRRVAAAKTDESVGYGPV